MWTIFLSSMPLAIIIPKNKCCLCGGKASFQGFSGKWFCLNKHK